MDLAWSCYPKYGGRFERSNERAIHGNKNRENDRHNVVMQMLCQPLCHLWFEQLHMLLHVTCPLFELPAEADGRAYLASQLVREPEAKHAVAPIVCNEDDACQTSALSTAFAVHSQCHSMGIWA